MNKAQLVEAMASEAKITKAADYIASVYHYLEYEMKFSEYGHHLDNSDTLSEGQKMKIKEAELSAGQKKLDVDGDGEIEGSDLAKLRNKNESKKRK